MLKTLKDNVVINENSVVTLTVNLKLNNRHIKALKKLHTYYAGSQDNGHWINISDKRAVDVSDKAEWFIEIIDTKSSQKLLDSCLDLCDVKILIPRCNTLYTTYRLNKNLLSVKKLHDFLLKFNECNSIKSFTTMFEVA